MRSLLYSALMHGARAAALCVLWWQGRKLPAFRERWSERRAHMSYPVHAQHGVVVHAVSMGEVIAALPLVQQLRQQMPQMPIIVTCTTPTASALIQQRLGDQVTHLYLPFDTLGAVRRFLRGLKPRLLILMETELWPNLIAQAQLLGTRVVSANTRLSEKSARRYARGLWFITPTLCRVDCWLTQDVATRTRLLRLGIAPALVKITGNLKFDATIAQQHEQRASELRQLTQGRNFWLAASTHAGEEEQILQAHRQILQQRPDALLVLVPRHPQRFDAVAQLLSAQEVRAQRQSQSDVCAPETQVWLADSMGELMAWFAIAPAVFMGGSFVPQGGHNPLEPIQLGTAVITGPHVFNFQQVFDALQAEDASRAVQDASGLAQTVLAWFAQPELARDVGSRGQAWYQQQQGASERCMRIITPLLNLSAPPSSQSQGCFLKSNRLLWEGKLMGKDSEPAQWFDINYWQARQAVQGQATGRGTTWFIGHAGGEGRRLNIVWRHYYRGGLIGRIMGDRFIRWPGLQPRSWEEFYLLGRMRAWQLPVPHPLAAKTETQFLVQRCDILIERIDQARDWVELLQQAPLPIEAWERAGRCIAELHAHGIHHSDLNAHNLMLDALANVWIIDFDKCESRPIEARTDSWPSADLARLRRSLLKEEKIALSQKKSWHATESDWQLLCNAYKARFVALLVTAA